MNKQTAADILTNTNITVNGDAEQTLDFHEALEVAIQELREEGCDKEMQKMI